MIPQSIANNTTGPISYPSFPLQNSVASSSTSSFYSSSSFAAVSVPPQASLSPSRRRGDYMDDPQSPASGFASRPVIAYPDLPLSSLRPPPPAASPSSERQDARPRLVHSSSSSLSTIPLATAAPRPPTIPSDYPVFYWLDAQINTAGLKNLGNTCYMNATIQCLHATVPFARFFIGNVSLHCPWYPIDRTQMDGGSQQSIWSILWARKVVWYRHLQTSFTSCRTPNYLTSIH